MVIRLIKNQVKLIRFMTLPISINLTQVSQLLISNRNMLKNLEEDLYLKEKMKIEVGHPKITTSVAQT